MLRSFIMELFSKRNCDVCGGSGFISGRKLRDGILCNTCAAKLSPFFIDFESSTVAEIKKQLAYREENKKRLADFYPSITFDGSRNVYINPVSERFIVTELTDWRSGNPDIISFSQVTSVETEVRDNKGKIIPKDSADYDESYNPRLYKHCRTFIVTIFVNSPWFAKIELELNKEKCYENSLASLHDDYLKKISELKNILMRRDERYRVYDGDDGTIMTIRLEDDQTPPAPAETPKAALSKAWICPSCGSESRSNEFCESCGHQKPPFKTAHCAFCGRIIDNLIKLPKFCPECGKPLKKT